MHLKRRRFLESVAAGLSTSVLGSCADDSAAAEGELDGSSTTSAMGGAPAREPSPTATPGRPERNEDSTGTTSTTTSESGVESTTVRVEETEASTEDIDFVPDGPNIIFITADDLGWTTLPAYGNPYIETPAFERLVREGALYRRAFNACSSCSSSRATFATGQYPHTHGVTGLVHRFPSLSLPPEVPTVASLLADAGYITALQGKWHVSTAGPLEYGYVEVLNPGGDSSHGIADESAAVEFIARHVSQPFYLELNFMQTHLRSDGTWAMDPDFPVDPEAVLPLDEWVLPDWPEIRDAVARYFSQVRRMDAIVGQILAALDELGLTDRTLVAFLSDNGAPFPGTKKTLHDRGVGTPLIFRWPSTIAAGRVIEELVTTVDLPPTLLAAADVPVPEQMQGASRLEELRGGPIRGGTEVFSEIDRHSEPIPSRSIRVEGWRYIRNLDETPLGLGQLTGVEWAQRVAELPEHPWNLPRVPAELYDLEVDPHEQTNVVDDPAYADVRADLHERLRRWMEATGDPALADL